MNYDQITITQDRLEKLFAIEESFFYDFKAKDILPAKLSRTVSAFANSSGGEIYLGIRENTTTKEKNWEGFNCVEDANAHIQTITELAPIENYLTIVFLRHPQKQTYILQILVAKTKSIIKSSDQSVYIRKGAQNIPVTSPDGLRRLELDKGVSSFENESVAESSLDDLTSSQILETFVENIIPERDGISWVKQQHLSEGPHLTIAGALLFLDEPQIFLPKRSAIKIYRYKTSGNPDRDALDRDPLTIEGCAYKQIYDAVSQVKEIVDNTKKLGEGFESIQYPPETLHEIITNAVLHRDYSITTDIQIRIFDNRVEIESPGRLPGEVTIKNILDSQTARNPRIVRIINKFPDAPNKDVGEGLNTAFDAMAKLKLQPPSIFEKENSVLVIIKHEKLASPAVMVMEYMRTHDYITNSIGRGLTGEKSENKMKRVFWELRDQDMLEHIPNTNSSKYAWRLTEKGKVYLKKK